MKKSSITKLLIIAGLLQGCAGSINPQGNGTRQMLTGSKPLSLSSTKQCPRGIGFVRLYKDTLHGNKTMFNAKLALASKNIEKEFNVYNLLDENHPDLLQKGEKGMAKADLDTSYNSILVRVSDAVVERSSEKLNDSTEEMKNLKALKNVSGVQANINKDISINYNPKAKYYENWGEVQQGALSEVDMGEMNKGELKSVWIKIGKDYSKFPIPETIDSASLDHPLDQAFSAEIGKPLAIKINPKPYDVKGNIYVQFTNNRPGKDAITYNYIVEEGQGMADLQVPTTGMKEGEYIMNIFRSEIDHVDADEKTDGAQDFCMEVGTGIMGRVSISAPKPAGK